MARDISLFGVLIALLLAGAAAIVGYNIGLDANLAASGNAGVRYVPYGGGFGFGFPLFGLLFGILFFVLIIGLARRAWTGPGGDRGPWGGPGHWRGRDWEGNVPPMVDSMLQEWHRNAHSGTSSSPPGAPTPGR